MGLRITRAVNTLLYGGFGLENARLEETYEHRIWFRDFFRTHRGALGTAVLLVGTPTESRDFTLIAGTEDESIELDDGVTLTFLGIKYQDIESPHRCPECGNTWLDVTTRMQGRFEFDAPRNYTILRDDVSKDYE